MLFSDESLITTLKETEHQIQFEVIAVVQSATKLFINRIPAALPSADRLTRLNTSNVYASESQSYIQSTKVTE